MEITASHKLTYKSYKKFYNLTVKWLDYYMIALAILVLLMIIVYGVNIISGIKEVIPSFVTLLILEIVIWAFILCFPILSYKFTKVTNNVNEDYIFTKDNIFVKTTGKNIESQANVKYDVLKKVYETREYFYLYISRQQAYIVDKETVSDEAALRDMLISGVGLKKYIIKIKN